MEIKLNEENANEAVFELLRNGLDLFNNRKMDKAFEIFDSAIRMDPNCAEAHVVKGEALMGMFELEEAEECIRTYLRLNPGSSRAYRDLMDIYCEFGDFNNSLIYCNKLLETDGEDAFLFKRKAYFLSWLDEFDEALEFYDKAIALKPDFYDAVCDKAHMFAEYGYHQESLETYEEGIKLLPEKGEAYMGAAFAYERLGDKKKALEFLKKAHNLEPEDEIYKSHYEIMRYAEY
jgi:tetratricopeptide (TPR) repeat protein